MRDDNAGHPGLPFEFMTDPFLVTDAVRSGVSRGRLRGPALEAPFHGVRVPIAHRDTAPAGAPQPGADFVPERERLLARARAYLPLMDERQRFSHVTAARILDLPVPGRLRRSTQLHVLSSSRESRRNGTGVVGHYGSQAARGQLVAGLPIVSPTTVWHQLAASLSVDELVVLGDALLRRTAPLTELGTLRESLDRLNRHRGIIGLRQAIELVRPRTDSPRESECRLLLVHAGLPEPEVNATILDDDGNFVAYGDMVYRKYKVIVEYDGGQHRDDEVQYHRDVDRLDVLMALGWRVLRFNKSHLRDSGVIVARTREALVQRGWRP